MSDELIIPLLIIYFAALFFLYLYTKYYGFYKKMNYIILGAEIENEKYLIKFAKRNNLQAQRDLFYLYLRKGSDLTPIKSLESLQTLAEQGQADAQFNLGNMYSEGQGVPQNYGKAAEWYQKAADLGFAEAQFNLGYMHYSGLGVPRNHRKARESFQMAADQGISEASEYLKKIRK
jgi:TPR repeat protein